MGPDLVVRIGSGLVYSVVFDITQPQIINKRLYVLLCGQCIGTDKRATVGTVRQTR